MFGRIRARGAIIALALLALVMTVDRSEAHDENELLARFDVMIRRNLDHPGVMSTGVIDSLMRAYQGLPLGARVAAWARAQLAAGNVSYLFGRDPGGYVTEGRLAEDFTTDCVLFMCRTTELARSNSALEAVQFAFGTRFYGASIDRAVQADGRVDYADPSWKDYAEDMLRSGIWGEDVTKSCGEATLDAVGSSRMPADTLAYIPKAKVDYHSLQDGDIIWFVGDETRPGAAEARMHGTLIHHLGLVARDGDEVWLIHPAAVPLPGVYDTTGLVSLPLRSYLDRIERFKGIVVTRLVEF